SHTSFFFEIFLFSLIVDPRSLHSFPTRRSSDLGARRIRLLFRDPPRDLERVRRALRAVLLLLRGHRAVAAHVAARADPDVRAGRDSEEHTSELQSLAYLVCRLLLEKKILSLSYS